MVTFSHMDQGTAEARWAASGLAAIAELPLGQNELAAMRFVVLAAHPDDETLGAGGLLALLHSLGADVEVLLCTAGEGSHPDSATTTPEQLAAVRLQEFAAAMRVLGMAGRWRFLGLPDRGLQELAPEIAGRLREAIGRFTGPPQQLAIVAPYRDDGHSDHNTLGAVAADVAGDDGHGLLEYPIWYWLWASPEDPAWRSWARFPLSTEQQAAKRSAMDSHTSQIRPLSGLPGDEVLLGEGLLQHFRRSFETFAWTPPGAQLVPSPPHSSADAQRIFDAVHAKSDDPWAYTTSWYERRKRTLTLAALPQETYFSGLEIGCSIGTLTAELATRCTSLLAVDASGTALELAARRLAPFPGVSTRHLTLPADWPGGRFDLVVVSEVGYYLSTAELEVLLQRIQESMMPGGTLLLCHWRHRVSGWELDGDSVHALARNRLRWPTAGLYQERDFVLETLVAPADGSDAGDPGPPVS
ncbi:bifunctional PIG-L family deacetylase/class I SAM-dependent methyltransferase [Pseudarthrobacter sp. AL07]|uniref:bifunctional PIG-L family deacetylase/class I SAM-dependent methyltransferase n=1 Tax=unclassified Pseudarthrobacter TaxID=2647000 RepID=UPI00249AFE69|nr:MULTISPECIES: bifunctional PIG-L family deacetylase/class I SAM-dependent methyltransferase [unclassified Pseudarthrobacter]MDI3194036.1 bifunctional PIG-L family deacetylase/class I SAM-dependent methyltransferase [Pseudarthrobacter sp. AL20]MDI3208003.1 bifunctional PIG-L family deacetylase/class I SAM-dependent methyltransferase [Pseudarthrobacter sp. AL07]